MNAEDKNCNKSLIEDDLKEKREVMPEDRDNVDEKYQKCSIADCELEVQETLDNVKDKDKRNDRGKVVEQTDDDVTSLVNLGISEVERTKRLESQMERRRSLSKFQNLRNAMGVGISNNSCGQSSSLHIPKKNMFLYKSSSDLPGSAPTYMIKNNPFDLPYDPHEEKPILTGDSFQDEFMAAYQNESIFCRRGSSSLVHFASPELENDKHETYYETEFAIKQLRRLGASKVVNKEDDNKRLQEKHLIPNVVIDDKHGIEEGESSEKVVNVINHMKDQEVDRPEEPEVDHDVVSSDQSTSSYSSSEDEPILKPNKEAILRCLTMSRMRVMSQGNSFNRNAESFDCSPSALFDKSKTDSSFFGTNKRVHYGSTNSFASDMQVEVSDTDSPRSTIMSSIDEEGKRSLVNSTNPSESDLNEVRLRDIDEECEQHATEPGFSQLTLDRNSIESTMKTEKINEQDTHCFSEEDR